MTRKKAKNLYVVLVTSSLSHNLVYLVQAGSIDDAIEVFHLDSCAELKKMKNGRFRWGTDYYNSIKDLLIEQTDLAFEVRKIQTPVEKPVDEIFCSIDWGSVFYHFKESFPGAKKIGRFYEWYSPNSDFYALFIQPKYFLNKFKDIRK